MDFVINGNKLPSEEEIFFFQDNNRCYYNQYNGLYDFTIGISSKYLVKISGRDVKNNGYQNISPGFVIEPVHYQHIWKNTDQEIYWMQPPAINIAKKSTAELTAGKFLFIKSPLLFSNVKT